MHGRRSGAALLFASALALTLLAAAPVLRHPSERIYGAEIVGRHHDPFTVMRQFDGQAIPSPYLQPGTDWIGRGLARLIGPIPAYNAIILWTFPLAALFAWLLTVEITGSRLAGWIAGLTFAFSPFHVAQAAYHAHIAQVQWVALYFLALWQVTRAATVGRLVLFAAVTALVCLSNFYGALIAMTLTPVATMAFWLAPDASGRRGTTRDLWRAAGVWVAMVLSGVAAIAMLMPGVLRGEAPRAVAIGELSSYSAQLASYVVPPVDHPVLGGYADRFWTSRGNRVGVLEQQVGLGAGLLALAVAGLVLAGRRESVLDRSAAAALVAIALVAGWCSLAPEASIGALTVRNPSGWLFTIAPMFRSYARFAVVAHLMVAILAGAGAAALWSRGRPLARGLVIALLVVVVSEYAPIAARSRDVMPTEAHRWLAAGEPVARVLECRPAGLSDVNTSWLLRRPVLYLSGEEDCAASDIATRLRGQQVSHLLVRRNRREYQWLQTHPRPDLRLRVALADGAVWDVPPAPVADPYVLALHGPFPREYDDEKSWRWMGESATWTVVNPRPLEVVASFDVEVTAFSAPRSIAVAVNGVDVGNVKAEVVRRFVTLPEMRLRPGANLMTWRSVEPTGKPDDSLHNGDTRLLSISIGDWRPARMR
ncbi:MAG TPA: hypothetical protein VFV98_06350 [Vicinamibacterales bacterium]|nr:hypothetical protein [Vicinamibacterales bacterium]